MLSTVLRGGVQDNLEGDVKTLPRKRIGEGKYSTEGDAHEKAWWREGAAIAGASIWLK